MRSKRGGDIRIIDQMIAVMPDVPIRLKDWLTLLPEEVKPRTASGEAGLLVAERLATRDRHAFGTYVITEKGQQRRAEMQVLLAKQ
ncbi:hypothetical protein [Deinococcus hopiensis]|uniref:Uncharacterized protein n=1 Tax=Deinococcus hopiensis KR-140 TaxID=695939 RepID=A0A1W1VCV9_9DEIO|nr:hypothetical protein [Deinococcus hopiensis]SMB91212.1 hypothetical protein SAMN00790413_01046 [Deinococcus hopiensis KR-140]